MLKILESLDQFGVAFQPRIQYSKTQQKTVLGGIMSVIIYGTSLIYLVYVFYQWQSGVSLPKITTSQKIIKQQEFTLNETYLQFETRIFDFTKIDPFNPEALILQPKLFYFRNGQLIRNESLLFPNQVTDGFHQVNVSNIELKISNLKTDEQPEDEVMIILGTCQQETLKDGYKCANKSLFDAYFTQPTNTIVLRQFLKEFDPQEQTVETIGRESMISVQKNAAFQVQTYVRILANRVDTGALFESITEYEYITDYRASTAVLDLEYFSSILGFNVYVALYYKLDNIQAQQSITYPKLSEVLAEASSIASTLLLLSYIVVIVNQKQLQFEAIRNVICMYFPEFKKLKISKNIFGRIKEVKCDGKQLDLKSFQSQFQRLTKIGETKLSISNQIYELSRIQFMLQSMFTSEQIKEYHNIGIPLQSVFVEPSSKEESSSSTLKLEISSLNSMFKSPQVYPQIMHLTESETTNKHQLKESDFELFIQ